MKLIISLLLGVVTPLAADRFVWQGEDTAELLILITTKLYEIAEYQEKMANVEDERELLKKIDQNVSDIKAIEKQVLENSKKVARAAEDYSSDDINPTFLEE